MSVTMYWKERLAAHNPVYCDALRIDKLTVKKRPGQLDDWPHSVARSTLFDDYVAWHNEVYLSGYREADYYKQHPERLPQPVDELTFFSTMSPWLYIVGKKQQVRTYMVPHRYRYEDEWVEGKKNTYFVRLCEWQHHAAAFELNTGIRLDDASEYYEPGRAQMVADAAAAYLQKISENRQSLERSMLGSEEPE